MTENTQLIRAREQRLLNVSSAARQMTQLTNGQVYISDESLTGYERGRNVPMLDRAFVIAAFYGSPVEKLFSQYVIKVKKGS